MQCLKNILLALALIVTPVMAIEPPDDVQPQVVQIKLYCVPTMSRMAEIISDTWGESGVLMVESSTKTNNTIFKNEG